MTEAVIVSTARTPIGRARKGTLAGVDAFALAEVAVSAALERSGVPADDVDDLVLADADPRSHLLTAIGQPQRG
jgi:acetyl-CoA acetyltransferase